MITRIWHGWTTAAKADAYCHLLLTEVVPAIEARGIAGFLQIDVLRRDDGGEVEFTTVMLFDTIDAVRRFAGDDFAAAHVPAAARSLLARFFARAAHHDVVDRRRQPDHPRGRS